MNRIAFVLLAVAGVCGCGKKNPSETVQGPMLRLHWVGAANIPKTTNALSNVLALESTTQLRNETFPRLAAAAGEFWKKSLPAGAADPSAALRPLLDDLWSAESHLELRGSPERPDLLLAVQLDDARAEAWDKNLRQAATGWKLTAPAPFSSGSAKGWSATSKDLNVHYARSGPWTLAAIAHDSRPPFDAYLKTNRPAPPLGASIVDAHLDWPRLNRLIPLLANYSLPAMQFKMTPRGQTLRTEGKLLYSDPLSIKLEPWKIPTNTVMEPINSFTCAQGIAPLLKKFKGFSQLQLKNPPSQICLWAQSTMPVQSFMTMPIADPTNVINDIAARLPALVKAHITNDVGNFLWVSNRSEWLWAGLPLLLPHVRPLKEPGGEFLYAGLFALAKSNTAPAELFGQVLGRANLVYYDWEITQERLAQMRHITQLYDIIMKRTLPTTNHTAFRWTRDIEPFLGNSITEVSLASPKELSFVRNSHIGFTGFELMMFTRWVESAGFPLRYVPPPPLNLRTNRAAPKKPSQ